MRRDIIKDVEIKEPPLEELTRKYSTFSSIKRSCVGGCGCLVFLFILLILILKFALGVGPQEINAVPEGFPAGIPVYDQDNIETITYVSGSYKNRAIEIAALFPKIILSPLISALEKDDITQPTNDKTSYFKNLWKVVNSPVSDARDVVKIQWSGLKADPGFISSYYQIELKKEGYHIENETATAEERQFSYRLKDVSGTLYIKGKAGWAAESAILIVNYFPTTTKQTNNRQ